MLITNDERKRWKLNVVANSLMSFSFLTISLYKLKLWLWLCPNDLEVGIRSNFDSTIRVSGSKISYNILTICAFNFVRVSPLLR